MTSPVRSRTGRARALTTGAVAAAAAGALLAGCSSGAGRPAAASHHPYAAAAAPAASTLGASGDLAAGLLPSAAFGPGAQVQSVSAQEMQQALAMASGLSASAAGATVQPSECGAALQQVAGQLGAWTDAAAEGAMTGGVVTGEALARGGDAGTLTTQVAALRTACSGATVSAPGHGTATVTAQNVPLDGVPAGASGIDVSGVALTVAATEADGTSRTVPALVAFVRDGQRVMALVQASPHGGTLDPGAFSDLLSQAIRQQKTLD